MARHLLVGVLIGLLATTGGCAAPGLIVRNDVGQAVAVDPESVCPVHYEKADLQEAVDPFAEHLARLVLQRESQLQLRLSAWSRPTDPLQRALVEGYLGLCRQRGQPGDCWDVLDEGAPGLTVEAKRTVALRMALAVGLREAAEVVRNVNPIKVEALMLAWFAFYLASFVIPDVTVTKLIFMTMSATLIAFLGVDGFRNIIQGYRTMRAEAAEAQTFDQLRGAAERYGQRMGPSALRIVTAIVAWGLCGATGLATPISGLPGAAQAVVNAEAMGYQLAAVNGGSVAVSATGTATVVLTAEATVPEQGERGSTPEKASKQSLVTSKTERVVIEDGKFDYLFGRASGRAHNIDRAAENAVQMKRIGIQDSAEGRDVLRAHFENVAKDPSNITQTFSNQYGAFEVRESLFFGPGGHVKFESTWQVLEGGVRRFVTAIPFGG